MKKTMIAAALLFITSSAFAQELKLALVDTQAKPECTQWCRPYWKSMPQEEYAFFVAEAADCWTTLDIKNHADMEEANPILGKHPSDGRIIGMCVGAGLLHSAITYELIDGGAPRGLIKAWEYVTIAVESGFAAHNYSLGLRFRF